MSISPRPDAWVYFVRQRGGVGPIKIGCTNHVQRRLRDMQPGSPVDLELLASLLAPAFTEWRFHAKFVKDHIRHEWFAPSATLLADIAAINAGEFSIDDLPPALRLKSPRQVEVWRRLHQYRRAA